MNVGFAPGEHRPPAFLRPLLPLGGAWAHRPGLRAPALRLTQRLRKFVCRGSLRLQAPRLPDLLSSDFSKLREYLGIYVLGIWSFSKKHIFLRLFKREHSAPEVAQV